RAGGSGRSRGRAPRRAAAPLGLVRSEHPRAGARELPHRDVIAGPRARSTALASRTSASRALIGHEHMDANHASLRRGADLHEVAEMIREPQAASARLIGCGMYAPDQRLLDAPGVADLTHQRAGLAPDPQPAFAPAMGDAVARELVDRQLQVLAAPAAKAHSATQAGHELAQHAQATARE